MASISGIRWVTSPAVVAGEGDRERGAVGVGDQVVLGAKLAAVDRAGAGVLPL
jgi:hypothetical protein